MTLILQSSKRSFLAKTVRLLEFLGMPEIRSAAMENGSIHSSLKGIILSGGYLMIEKLIPTPAQRKV